MITVRLDVALFLRNYFYSVQFNVKIARAVDGRYEAVMRPETAENVVFKQTILRSRLHVQFIVALMGRVSMAISCITARI